MLGKLLIQRLNVGLVRFFLCPVCLTVGLEFMGAVDVTPHLICALGIFRQRIGGVHTGVVAVIALPHFSVNTVQHGVAGNLRRVAELVGRLLFLKERRVVIFPSESTTRCFTSFFGIFASAFSSFLIFLSAFEWQAQAPGKHALPR